MLDLNEARGEGNTPGQRTAPTAASAVGEPSSLRASAPLVGVTCSRNSYSMRTGSHETKPAMLNTALLTVIDKLHRRLIIIDSQAAVQAHARRQRTRYLCEYGPIAAQAGRRQVQRAVAGPAPAGAIARTAEAVNGVTRTRTRFPAHEVRYRAGLLPKWADLRELRAYPTGNMADRTRGQRSIGLRSVGDYESRGGKVMNRWTVAVRVAAITSAMLWTSCAVAAPDWSGTYTSTVLLDDGFTHTEENVVSGLNVTGSHTFTNGATTGSFS